MMCNLQRNKYFKYNWKGIWKGIDQQRWKGRNNRQRRSKEDLDLVGLRSKERRANSCVAFMYLEMVDHKVCRELWRVLHECGFHGYLIRNMSCLYGGSRAHEKLVSRLREYFEVKRGLRQGCVMSPWLFNVFFDRVVTQVNDRITR